ncbi:MAG: DUF4331 family protein [Bacteroidetes bacterium]|nr:DUF4331 family protein [Bacteroidota bacterium]
MKKNSLNSLSLFLLQMIAICVIVASCKKDHQRPPERVDVYEQDDQMGRPAINTVFISAPDKDKFNTTVPTDMPAVFGAEMKAKLLALNPGYTTNLLGLTADQFIGVLSTDVLNVSKTGVTTFYDGKNVLTGRALSDDVIDVELTLLFGGPDGSANPGLTSDHVNGNDAAFIASFPYLARPH